MEYVDASPEIFYHSEGRIIMGQNNAQYKIVDHLGNTVVLFEDSDNDGTITSEDETAYPSEVEVFQRNLYYPFGLSLKGTWVDSTAPRMNYLYNGKEWNNEGGLGWLDYGFRWYDPAVGRFPSVDPLAAKYAAISPYAYVANNPILNVDPDGMEIINADKLRLAQRKMRYDRFKASEKYQTYHGLTRKQAKDQFGKKGVKSWKYVKNTATKYEKVISKYEFRANKTDAIMKKWQKESPNLYKKIDGMSVDLYLGVDESVSSGREGDPFGATGSPIEENGKYIYKVGDLSVEGALPVFINSGVNMDSIDDETGEYSLNHEGGHFIFAVENPKQYFQDKRSIKAKGEDYNAGHHPDATTGKEAKKYGTKKDIEQ